jgi:hypothetical protein
MNEENSKKTIFNKKKLVEPLASTTYHGYSKIFQTNIIA